MIRRKKKENEPFLENISKIKEKRNKKILHNLELIVIVVFSIIMLILLCNRTFFRTNYKNSKINIDIPLLMFFKSDKDNKLVLKTLRKSQYIEDFFEDEFRYLTKYNCGDYSFYYDSRNLCAIYGVDIDKDFAIKTVTIEYAYGDADCLCNINEIGKKAEELCLR